MNSHTSTTFHHRIHIRINASTTSYTTATNGVYGYMITAAGVVSFVLCKAQDAETAARNVSFSVDMYIYVSPSPSVCVCVCVCGDSRQEFKFCVSVV